MATIRILLAVFLSACTPAVPVASLAPSASASAAARPSSTPTDVIPEVDGKRALEHIAFFTDPAQGGRYSGSPGYDRSARYVADRFAEIGLEPWGDAGTYFEHFKMPIVDLASTPLLTRTAPDARTFRHRVDFTERVGGIFGSGTGEGALVFIGGGATTSSASDLDKVDVAGKIAIVINAGRTDPAPELVRRGAAGAIYVTSGGLLKFSYIARFAAATIPSVVVTTAVANELLAPSGKTVAELVDEIQAQARAPASSPAPSPAFELPERVRLSVPLTPLREAEATNVVGLLRGADPNDAKQAVVVGGHLDGVGTDPDGTVFQAANDNASGPGLTIEVARALAGRKGELRHSVIFVAWAGEEQGLNGSDAYVAQFAALPGRRESLLGYLNLDVVGCCGGSISASTENGDMVERVRRAAERAGVPFTRGGRGSSDQESFTRRNIPATLLNWSDIGVIHSTADSLDTIAPDRLRTIGRVAALVALELSAGR